MRCQIVARAKSASLGHDGKGLKRSASNCERKDLVFGVSISTQC